MSKTLSRPMGRDTLHQGALFSPPLKSKNSPLRQARFVAIVLAVILVVLGTSVLPSPADEATRATLTAEERAWLDRNTEKLVLWFNTEFPPIEFADAEGRFTGMGADVIAMVEERLGITFIKRASDDWNAHLTALENGQCAVAPTIVATPQRERYALFTPPYATVPVVIITSQGRRDDLTLEDLGGQRVAVVSGYATERYLRDHSGERFEVVLMPDVSHGVRAVSFGQVDAFVGNLAVAAYYIEKEGLPNLRVAGSTPYGFAWSIGISRHYPLLASAVRKALAAIPADELEGVRRRWISLEVHRELAPETLRLLISVIMFVSLLTLGLVAISTYLRRRLKEKVANLNAAQKKLIEQTELLQLATEATQTQAGIWDFRPANETAYLSKQWFGMLGYEPQDREIPFQELGEFVHPDDLPRVMKAFDVYVDQGGRGLYEHELRLRQSDGGWCWAFSKGRAVDWDAEGRPSRIIGLDINIQSLKEAQEKMAQNEAKFRAIFENAPYSIVIYRLEDGQFVEANKAFLEVRNIRKQDLLGLHVKDCIYTSEEETTEVIQTLLKTGSVRNREVTVKNLDGTSGHAIYSSVLMEIQGQRQILSVTVDVTERKRAEEALQESMELLKATFNATSDGILVVNKDLKVTQANQQFYRMWRIPPALQQTDDDDALRGFVLDQLEDPAGFQANVARLYNSQIQDMYEIPFRDGRVFECYSAPIIKTGKEIGRVWDFRDITERKNAEKAIDLERRQLLSVFNSMNEIIYVSDPYTYEMIFANQHLKDLIGQDPTGKLCHKALQGLDQPCDFCTNAIILSNNGQPYRWEHHNPITQTDVAIVDQIIRWPDGRDVRLEIAVDITERKKAEKALQASERKLRSIFAAMTDVILILDAKGRYLEIAPTKTSLLYRPPEELLGKTIGDVFPPDKVDLFLAAVRSALSSQKSVSLDYELQIGSRRVWFAATISPLSPDQVILVARDISNRKQAQEERERLQDQLLQSQKLEAVGTLAGGVAHDFNNMLGAIMGYAELAMGEIDTTHPLYQNISHILDAAKRSARLTRQLLAFARKQTIAPETFDLNEAVEALLKMLRRLIGENIDLAWLPGPDPCNVKLDPSQFDQILANLCVNARDAIADVGRVTIEADLASFDATTCRSHAGCAPGEYVVLAVSDTGCGMDKETLDHIFEPFFTTKAVGEGTGLGLATVYGIVKQNDGFINVYSEPGQGTTFKIYFPRHTAEVTTAPTVGQDVPRSRGETILLVEDDPILLEMSRLMLGRLGYRVLAAETPGKAIRLVEENQEEIHLFLTDVVMPEMNGRDLAERLQKIRPTIKHLFMSGYSSNVIAHQGVLDPGVNFIQKPFSLNALANKIRQVLDDRSGRLGTP